MERVKEQLNEALEMVRADECLLMIQRLRANHEPQASHLSRCVNECIYSSTTFADIILREGAEKKEEDDITLLKCLQLYIQLKGEDAERLERFTAMGRKFVDRVRQAEMVTESDTTAFDFA